MATCGICAIASGLALSPPLNNFWLMLGLFFLLSVTHEGVRLGRKTYLVDMATGNRRTDYVAVSNTIIGLLLLVLGMAGAALAQVSIVAVLALFSLSGLFALLTALRLPEVQE
jgi:hypothetical protein